MRKLLHTGCMASFLIMAACSSIDSGKKMICKCSKANGNYTMEEKDQASEFAKSASFLPFNFWDTKMMIW